MGDQDGSGQPKDGRPTPTTSGTNGAQSDNTITSDTAKMAIEEVPELDDFGLPVRKYTAPTPAPAAAHRRRSSATASGIKSRKASTSIASTKVKGATTEEKAPEPSTTPKPATVAVAAKIATDAESGGEDFKDAVSRPASELSLRPVIADEEVVAVEELKTPVPHKAQLNESPTAGESMGKETPSEDPKSQTKHGTADGTGKGADERRREMEKSPEPDKLPDLAIAETKKDIPKVDHSRNTSLASTGGTLGIIGVDATGGGGLSEFSHQQLTTHEADKKDESKADDEWQTMPAYAPYDLYDDDDKLIAREQKPEDEKETYGYGTLGGAGKGYTRVIMDDDVESVNSIDESTQHLFKNAGGTSLTEDEESQRDAVSQLQATKDLLTEGQRIAYVGLTRLEMSAMVKEVEALPGLVSGRRAKKMIQIGSENMKMWSQKMMVRLYTHMDISPAEQVMIEQLSDHGVMPSDLTPVLMANARVKNPMAEEEEKHRQQGTPKSGSGVNSPRPSSVKSPLPEEDDDEPVAEPPPPYSTNGDTELSEPVKTPSQMPTTDKIDIDIRWTVLCDLFLVLIADSIYDSRSRVLLEKVGRDLEIPWLDICRFEKKVTDALEMQQNAEKENWNEEQHMESRRKLALKRRYVLMGLATVGGGLVIGLSAGLMAPLIGAGLAAGFTAIGVSGTGTFLAGTAGAAIITSGAAASGSVIGVRAADRRTGAVKTFEYRPLHNNKRVNLIITVSGWMTGKVDDVRLPYSTVDPTMGDIYSVLWEPEMLTSMGDTINILATEALTQGLQQVLSSTALFTLMAALQVPVILTKLAYLIDNPWAVSLDRATMAGNILADSLIDRNLGTRPVTLVGYSLGSRVIFACLQELARKGAFGLVQNVYLFGSPVVVKHDEYMRARAVVSGRFVNGYNRNDWILGYLFRLTNGGIRRIAGLAPLDGIPGVENMDVTEWVVGHMNYRTAMPRLLRECGWLVESDEFTEIEDPDPENHQERQRELINEIEEARKELEKEGKVGKGKFGFFSRKKRVQKQEWEVYEDALKSKAAADAAAASASGASAGRTDDNLGNNHGVLFDVDAIRAELAKEAAADGKADEEPLFQVKEIKSTLPPMKLELSPGLAPPTPAVARTPRDALRETKSAEAVPYRPSHEYRSSQDLRPSPSPTPSHERRISSSERTPTFPSAGARSRSTSRNGANGYFMHEEPNRTLPEDDSIQMTFDTSFDDENRRPPTPPPKNAPMPNRPEMKTSQTVPNITFNSPWADSDDEEFGKEKEISMTFA